MAEILKPDLCVIGAGALGISLALQARQRGLAVVLVEQPNSALVDPAQGSQQRAAFLASAARAHAIRTASLVGLDNGAPKPNFRAISEHAAAVATEIAPRDTEARLTALGITVLPGAASFADRQTLLCGDASIRARHFALATGAAPLLPALPGIDQVSYFTPDTIGDNIRKLSHLVVIGGEPAAVELAQAYARLGSQVTLIPQGSLLPDFEPELVAILAQVLRDEGVVIRDDAIVTAIVPRSQGTGVTLQTASGQDSLDVSHILLAMGQLPVLDGALLDKLNLRRDRLHADRLQLGPDGQTSNGRVSAVGAAANEHHPAIAARQLGLLVERLLGLGNGRLDPHILPRFIATQPALAQVGIDVGRPLRPGQTVLRANLAETEAARAVGQPHGAVRLVVTGHGDIVGAAAIGLGAGEVIAMLALAMAHGLKLQALGQLALPQPSVAAALLDLAAQHQAQQPPVGWARRLPAIGRLLP